MRLPGHIRQGYNYVFFIWPYMLLTPDNGRKSTVLFGGTFQRLTIVNYAKHFYFKQILGVLVKSGFTFRKKNITFLQFVPQKSLSVTALPQQQCPFIFNTNYSGKPLYI